MSQPIRIGTRDSKLALYQAKTVQRLLEENGHETVLVPVKSTGDLVLDKPLYELGITGVFTKTLDIAMLNEEIDIAVHSLKDVPTRLPKGIVQACVIKRGHVKDALVFKDNEEFLAAKDAVIATSSLRRKAQWLNRYPTHRIEDIRGNVNSRLEKLANTPHWNGAIFAAAGLGRLRIRPEQTINLDWMIPAPAQGAIMVTALEEHTELVAICKEINDEETEICTTIERDFLNKLEGGCTAPIGALAQIKDDEIHFEGVLLSPNGSKKITVSKVAKRGNHDDLAEFCANYIIERGGKNLMDALSRVKKEAQVFSTKSLSETQEQLVNQTLHIESYDFIKTNPNRIPKQLLKQPIEHVIITSKNAVDAILTNCPAEDLKFKNIYCVGRRTKKLIEQRIGKVTHVERNAKRLAEYLIEYISLKEVTYFCSNLRLDHIPNLLAEQHIKVNEVEAYNTKFDSKPINKSCTGVLFYSPSTVQSFLLKNDPNFVAFCIGESTAQEARKHFKDVQVAKVPTVESVIELVNRHVEI